MVCFFLNVRIYSGGTSGIQLYISILACIYLFAKWRCGNLSLKLS